MTEIYWLYALGVYLTSVLMYLTLVYYIREEIIVNNVIVSLAPAINTIALLIGLVMRAIAWYQKSKNTVVFKKVKKIPKPPKPRK